MSAQRHAGRLTRIAPFLIAGAVALVLLVVRGRLGVGEIVALAVVVIAFQAGRLLTTAQPVSSASVASAEGSHAEDPSYRRESGSGPRADDREDPRPRPSDPQGPTAAPEEDERQTRPETSTEQEPFIDQDRVGVPHSLRSHVVLRSLFEGARSAGSPVASHLWIDDPASGTLRLLDAYGPMPPSDEPRRLDDSVIGRAVGTKTARIERVASMTDGGPGRTMYRFAVPLDVGDHAAAAVVDLLAPPDPDEAALVDTSARLRGALAGAVAVHIAREEARLTRSLLDGARRLSQALRPDTVLRTTLDLAMELVGAATGSVMLRDEQSGNMRIRFADGLDEDVVERAEVRPGEGIAGWVLASGKPLLVEDLPGRGTAAPRPGVRSAISVPLTDEAGALGVLNVGSRDFPARFGRSHLDALQVLASQATVAYRNALAVGEARDLYFSTLRTLATAMESKDPYARGAADRIQGICVALAGRLGLDERTTRSIEIAALVHDLGMVCAGDLSARSGPLSTVERGMLAVHPSVAADLIAESPALRDVAPIVYHHHEHYDGSGYVDGLRGEDIPVGSRVLAVADAFVAMTSERPYRRAKTLAETVCELRAQAGGQFDPRVVDALLDLLEKDPASVKGGSR